MRAINTDVLIEKYGDWYVEDWTGERFIGNMRGFVYDVVPTVDVVELKKGKWIVDEDGNIECSVCGHHGVGDLYCERCGAKMDEKERGWKK